MAKAGQRAAWVVMQPLTGRTHQLRLHMQLLGAPIAGDPKYMTDRPLPGGLENMLHLHAHSLTLPREGQNDLYLQAPIPAHMEQAFDVMGFNEADPSVDWDELE